MENRMITLQGFLHFLKVMNMSDSKEDASGCTQCMKEIDGVTVPFRDTLNIFNGLNYA